MNRVKQDPFWDGGSSGNVRCSSIGEDANTYHDPATQFFEGNGGRSIASLLPGGRRAVILPRATIFGGSRGFDPHKPRIVNIDPDIKGQSCVVDLSKITPENMEAAFQDAAQNPIAQQDIHLLASQTFHNLAVGYEPVGMDPSYGPISVDRRAPMGEFSAYVVPRAGLGGGQILDEIPLRERQPEELISPSVTPRGSVAPLAQVLKQAGVMPRDTENNMPNVTSAPLANRDFRFNDYYQVGSEQQTKVQQVDEQGVPLQRNNGFVDQTPQNTQKRRRPTTAPPRAVKLQGPPQQTQVVEPPMITGAPSVQVTFGIEGWGELEATYHEVIKNDCILVLVFDTRFKGGGKYFPPDTEKVMAVRIGGTDKTYYVNSYGTRFQHGFNEYCILIVRDTDAIGEDIVQTEAKF